MGIVKKLSLQAGTPLEKEIRTRVLRGVEMLDAVTPGWETPINPATLAVSNREFCVFAQAQHSFKKGIIQVAEKAAKEGKPVKTLAAGDYTHEWDRGYMGREVTAESRIVDVFYYGFDVDAQLEKLAGRSRRTAWSVIDKMWTSVVKQKKGLGPKKYTRAKDIIALLKDPAVAKEIAKRTGASVYDANYLRNGYLDILEGREAR